MEIFLRGKTWTPNLLEVDWRNLIISFKLGLICLENYVLLIIGLEVILRENVNKNTFFANLYIFYAIAL